MQGQAVRLCSGDGISGLTGKPYNTPCYQLLVGKYRDSIRLYARYSRRRDPDKFVAKLKDRLKEKALHF
jgi:L-alanine-DL-glutamate epimerase-like enolase superfamily enzyme